MHEPKMAADDDVPLLTFEPAFGEEDEEMEDEFYGLREPRYLTEAHANGAADVPIDMEQNSTIEASESESYDAFLTHDWGVDQEGRNNHERVVRVGRALKALGVNVWIDEERMTGHISQTMQRGIDSSSTFVIFLTKRYMEKVDGQHGAFDNCKLEFDYATKLKPLIAVVMEPQLSLAIPIHG
eukprot:TRINITY_DN11727_c0_g1_i1.p4 TRINITY_DN11727_c0_g1~~TRINITY_DN11727_c0_g1_i1.p4  ORF type:complete len:183 (+),score=48.86 TRINITY_DN11727_c0_g1_i1:2458-3006(+)